MDIVLLSVAVWFADGSMGWPEPGRTYPKFVSEGALDIVRTVGGEIVERRCLEGVCRERKIGFVPIFDPPALPAPTHETLGRPCPPHASPFATSRPHIQDRMTD